MLLALWPAFMYKPHPVAMNPPMLIPLRKPFESHEVFPQRIPLKVDKLRDDDSLFVILLM